MSLRVVGLFILGIFVFSGMFLSLWAVSKLEKNSKESSKSLSILISSLLVSSLTYEETYSKLQEVISGIDFPVAIIDNDGKVRAYKNVSEEDIHKLRFKEDIMYYDKKIGELKYDYPAYTRVLRMITFILYGGMAILIFLIIYSFYFSIRYEQAEFWMGFAKGLAHQLATPVSSLYGWYEIVKENIPEDARKGIKKDLERLSSVLRRFSKLGGTLILEDIDVVKVVEGVVKDMAERYRNSANITFIGEGIITVKGDAELLGWAVENMIKNSVEAGADKIKVKVKIVKNRVCISIVDNGKGFSKNEQKMAFKKSFSTKQRGWGVGLMLVKKIADIHRGTVFIEKSDPFFETIITLCIPYKNISTL